MRPAPQRIACLPARGFTLVEIMIVVVIIGLLAAMAIPAFQRIQRASQNTRVINDWRVFSQSFEIYNASNGTWPDNVSAGVVPTSPVSMAGDFKADIWQSTTPIGGRWNWDKGISGIAAGVSISGFTCTDEQLLELDNKMDDGVLTTGRFRQIQPTRVMLIIEED